MWNDTALTRRLGIRYPIVQGPFGGGLSSARLVAAVSNAGGLGSFGAQGMTPNRISDVVGEIRALTASPFAVNLWVSTEDAGASGATRSAYNAALLPLAPFFNELRVHPPAFPLRGWATFDEQVSALLDARPPAFSFVFGIPPAHVIDECRRRSIVTIGTATTVDEAVALESSGVDVVVASGFEAGGHRPSFLRSPETSLTGLFSLLPQVCGAVDIPVIAAGGIADGRGSPRRWRSALTASRSARRFWRARSPTLLPLTVRPCWALEPHTRFSRGLSPAVSPGGCATPWPTPSKTDRRRFCRIRSKVSWQGHYAKRRFEQAAST